MILEWGLGRGEESLAGVEPGKGKEAGRGKDLELVALPKLEVEALRFPLTSLDPLPLFSPPRALCED